MKKVRQGVFETNSSSTHSICIAKETKFELPKSLHLGFGEFGWECDVLRSTQDKVNYLYTGLVNYGSKRDLNRVLKFLSKSGVVLTKEEPVYETRSYTDSSGKRVTYKHSGNIGYVDHGDELKEFLTDICSDQDKLFRYLFSDLSFIITGNDTDDHDVEINVDYPYDSYYKGN